MNSKEITRDIMALLIVGGVIASLFLTVNVTGEAVIRTLGAAVIGSYFAVPSGIISLGAKRKAKK